MKRGKKKNGLYGASSTLIANGGKGRSLRKKKWGKKLQSLYAESGLREGKRRVLVLGREKESQGGAHQKEEKKKKEKGNPVNRPCSFPRADKAGKKKKKKKGGGMISYHREKQSLIKKQKKRRFLSRVTRRKEKKRPQPRKYF